MQTNCKVSIDLLAYIFICNADTPKQIWRVNVQWFFGFFFKRESYFSGICERNIMTFC